MRKAVAEKLNTVSFGGWRTCMSLLTNESGQSQIPKHHCT